MKTSNMIKSAVVLLFVLGGVQVASAEVGGVVLYGDAYPGQVHKAIKAGSSNNNDTHKVPVTDAGGAGLYVIDNK